MPYFQATQSINFKLIYKFNKVPGKKKIKNNNTKNKTKQNSLNINYLQEKWTSDF